MCVVGYRSNPHRTRPLPMAGRTGSSTDGWRRGVEGARTAVFSARCRAFRVSACKGAVGPSPKMRGLDRPCIHRQPKSGARLDEPRPSVNDCRKSSLGGKGWAVRRQRDLVQQRTIGAYVRSVAKSLSPPPSGTPPVVLVVPAEDATELADQGVGSVHYPTQFGASAAFRRHGLSKPAPAKSRS